MTSPMRDMLASGDACDAVCQWCGEDAPSLEDAEALFGAPDCGHICPACADARAKELDEPAYDRPVHEMEGWR